MRVPLLGVLLTFFSSARADVTVYGVLGSTTAAPSQSNTGTSTSSISYVTTPGPARYTGLAAYNDVYLPPPPIPSPPPSNNFAINVPKSSSNVVGLSIPQAGTFFGFSIEMSVATQLIGTNSTRLFVPFLNLMSLIVQRVGAVHVRVGGNTQDTAYMVDSFPDGRILEKDKEDASNPTYTPVLAFTVDLIYMLSNVSSLVNTKWYLGVPFNDTNNLRLQIAELGEEILGDNLIGFQAGNEPDLYGANNHGHRPKTYSPWDYFGEFGVFTQAYNNDTKITRKKSLIAPSTDGGNWPDPLNPSSFPIGAEPVWNTGFVQQYDDFLSALAVEHYPLNNCADLFPGLGTPADLLTVLAPYLTHNSGLSLVQPHLNSTSLAQTWNKPFLMFETNTASCGGFPGVSDAFAAALWGVDYGLQMANSNFTGALFHAGGQNVTYNPFTAAPTNESSIHQWTVGPIFYSALVVAEALGSTNTSRVKDLFPNNGSEFTPAYAVYENDQLARMVLINFLDDPSGANDYTASISVGGQQFGEAGAVPAQVKVKYLLAPSVSEKQNITWAGQTLGGRFQADGRLQGTEVVQTVQCDQTANTCAIKVPAPGAALVFVSDGAQQQADALAAQTAATYATTVVTKTKNTATVDPSVLATSNGNNGKIRGLNQGGTSQGGENGAVGAGPTSVVAVALTAVLALSLSASLSVGLFW
ncbi:hypothetical protein C2E23DRAFT_734171 [Lenzites betulinus]|nr:hypothetical protein C2E23DRAFT_734171 [Lenzites betulinus]